MSSILVLASLVIVRVVKCLVCVKKFNHLLKKRRFNKMCAFKEVVGREKSCLLFPKDTDLNILLLNEFF